MNPGERLRAFARRICSPGTMDRIIDPLLADLQFEHAAAMSAGRPWRARWRRMTGAMAFWRTLTMCATRSSVVGIPAWAAADEHAMGRTLAYSAAITAALVLLLALLPFYAVTRTNRVALREFARLFLYIIPQAIPLAMVFGLPLGILMGLRGRSAKRRVRWNVLALCVVSAAVAFGICGWVLPDANQAFREAVVGGRRPLARGANELTFPELTARLDALKRVGRLDAARPLLYSYHARLAASAAPFVWGLFALTLASVTRRTLLSTAIVVIAGITYIACAIVVIDGGMDTFVWVPLAYVIWLPNALFALMTIALRVASSNAWASWRTPQSS